MSYSHLFKCYSFYDVIIPHLNLVPTQDVMTSERKRSLREMNSEGHRSISKMIFIEQLDILVGIVTC